MNRLKRHKKIINFNKGYRGSISKLFRRSCSGNTISLINAYIGRKRKKRIFKNLWIKKVNAFIKLEYKTINYSRFINYLKYNNINLNKKILYHLLFNDKNIIQELQNNA